MNHDILFASELPLDGLLKQLMVSVQVPQLSRAFFRGVFSFVLFCFVFVFVFVFCFCFCFFLPNKGTVKHRLCFLNSEDWH